MITDPPYSSGGQVRGDRMGSARAKYVSSDAQHNPRPSAATTATNAATVLVRAVVECLVGDQAGRRADSCSPTGAQLPATTDAAAGGWVWRASCRGSSPTPGRRKAVQRRG